MKRNASTISAVDLFCGVGGLTYGLQLSGIDVRLGVDKDDACAFAFKQNNKARFLSADVAELTADEIRKVYPQGAVTLLAGCAPCQPFSTYSRAAKRDASVSRPGRGQVDDWKLVHRFGELVMQVLPDLVTMENVPPLKDQPVFREFLETISAVYHVDYRVIECTSVGLPQTRKRLVLVASRLGPITLPDFSEPTKSVRDTIAALPAISAGTSDPSDPMHVASRLSDLNLRRIRASRPGGTWRDWPEDMRATCHQRPSGATYPAVYGRMEWDAPGPTITTQAFGFGNGRFGHPEQDRAISLREASMLQGFPRTYKFVRKDGNVSFATLGRLIGNAVPVPLAAAIGDVLRHHVEGLRAA